MNSDVGNTGLNDPSIMCITDDDSISIASDFTRISESVMKNDEFEEVETPMTVSFYRSEESVAAPTMNPHSSVKFGSIKMIGSEFSTLSVMFHIAEDFVPRSSDRVGLYKTGFSSSKDFLCFKWTPCTASPLENPVPYTVLFEANDLPSEREEFYQVCYLMQNGKIAGVSNPFQLTLSEACGPKVEADEVENAARNVLSIRVRELMQENGSLREQLKSVEDSLSEAKDAFALLEKEKVRSDEEKSEQSHLILSLKKTLALREEHIEKYKLELFEKDEELNRDKLETKDLQCRLTAAVMSLSDLKESLAVSEEGKSVTEERQQVLLQDNQDLKESLRLVKEELETCMKEKSAAEKIASDLSHHLQAKEKEYQTLMDFNARLVKRVKKQKKVIALMEASEDFVRVEADADDEEETKSDVVGSSLVSSSAPLASGCPSSGMSGCPHLNETVNSVSQRMDEIVNQLSWQTEEMKFLKKEIAKKREGGEEGKVKASSGSVASKKGSGGSSEDDREQVLYGKSFLPANCTAPVFLPSSRNSEPKNSRPSSMERTTQTSLQNATPSAPSPTPSIIVENSQGSRLPAPLQPVATPLARNAAVLRQFSDNGSSLLVTEGQQQEFQQHHLQHQELQQYHPVLHQEQPVYQQYQERYTVHQMQEVRMSDGHAEDGGRQQQQQQESDDDDFHSTGDAREFRPLNRVAGVLRCPLCPIEFLPEAIHLLEEHTNNHLDRSCPVCSLIFARDTPHEKFSEHVHSHFSDAEEESDQSPSPPDPTGPWRTFQLLEID